jgi:hypothetical protein
MAADQLTVTTKDDGAPRMGFGLFLATDGGTRCPQCGKFAKPEQLGNLSFGDGQSRVTMYGHKPGFGCNKEKTNGS